MVKSRYWWVKVIEDRLLGFLSNLAKERHGEGGRGDDLSEEEEEHGEGEEDGDAQSHLVWW